MKVSWKTWGAKRQSWHRGLLIRQQTRLEECESQISQSLLVSLHSVGWRRLSRHLKLQLAANHNAEQTGCKVCSDWVRSMDAIAQFEEKLPTSRFLERPQRMICSSWVSFWIPLMRHGWRREVKSRFKATLRLSEKSFLTNLYAEMLGGGLLTWFLTRQSPEAGEKFLSWIPGKKFNHLTLVRWFIFLSAFGPFLAIIRVKTICYPRRS